MLMRLIGGFFLLFVAFWFLYAPAEISRVSKLRLWHGQGKPPRYAIYIPRACGVLFVVIAILIFTGVIATSHPQLRQ